MATLAALVLVPGILAVENWDDHDRSGRYVAHDFAYNYLVGLDEYSVVFTNGDNDTFPLWYIQEVENHRTDVRVGCMPFMPQDWYIDQMRWQNYSSAPLPLSIPQATYDKIPGNTVYVRENERSITLDYMSTFMTSNDPRTKLPLRTGEKVDFIPTHRLVLPVDSARVRSS